MLFRDSESPGPSRQAKGLISSRESAHYLTLSPATRTRTSSTKTRRTATTDFFALFILFMNPSIIITN